MKTKGWKKEARNVNKSVCKAILINVAGDHGKLSIIYQLNKMVMSVKTLASQREANSQKNGRLLQMHSSECFKNADSLGANLLGSLEML